MLKYGHKQPTKDNWSKWAKALVCITAKNALINPLGRCVHPRHCKWCTFYQAVSNMRRVEVDSETKVYVNITEGQLRGNQFVQAQEDHILKEGGVPVLVRANINGKLANGL